MYIKNLYRQILYCFLVFVLIFLPGCSKEVRNFLSVNPGTIEFSKDGSSTGMSIRADAGTWSIHNPASDWLELSSKGGTGRYGSGLFNRHTNTVSDQQALDALVQGASD